MTAVDRDRTRLRSVLIVSVLAAALLVITAPSTHPSTMTWSGLEAWYETVGPSPAAAGLLWLVAAAVAAWLIIGCLLQLFARRSGGGWLRPLADCVAPAALRGIATVSITATLALTSPASAGAGGAPGTATLHPLGADEVTTTSSPVVTSPTVAPAGAATPAPVPPDEYTVRAGDSFWVVAMRRLAAQGSGALTPASHHEYWRRLIAANVDRLVDAGNPDLLYPGQVLVLPPLT